MSGLSDVVRVARLQDRSFVLGPGVRAVIWVQGCSIGCRGCVVPEFWPDDQGTAMTVDEIVTWLLGIDGIEGVTISGGEPMEQATPLVSLCDRLRKEAPDLSIMAYTGHDLADLIERGSRDQIALLSHLDILVDGPFEIGRRTNLLWRGSSNQRIHLLTGRYEGVADLADDPAGLEVALERDGSINWTGVPVGRFRSEFAAALRDRGLHIEGRR